MHNQLIRLLIADDHTVVRQGLRFMLEQRPDITIVAECSDADQAIASAAQVLPDVILLDLLMPGREGTATIREMTRLAPSAQIIVLTSFHEDEQILGAIKAGARSYLLKDSSPHELVNAIRAAAQGIPTLHPLVATRLLRAMQEPHGQDHSTLPLSALTPREREVLECIAHGRSNAQIATALTISEPTVRTHIANILGKLHLADRTQAAIYALQQRIVPLDEALDSP